MTKIKDIGYFVLVKMSGYARSVLHSKEDGYECINSD